MAERRKRPTRRKDDKVEDDLVVVKMITAGERAKALLKTIGILFGALALTFTAGIGAYRFVYFEWQAFQQEVAQREAAAKLVSPTKP